MKRNYSTHFRTASLALGFALFSAQATPVLLAQQTPAQQPREQQEPSEQQDQKTQTFVGKIVKARNGQFALLTDEQNGKGVYLDDQDKAKGFEGKNVKVTGVLDVARNTLHVTDISEA